MYFVPYTLYVPFGIMSHKCTVKLSYRNVNGRNYILIIFHNITRLHDTESIDSKNLNNSKAYHHIPELRRTLFPCLYSLRIHFM